MDGWSDEDRKAIAAKKLGPEYFTVSLPLMVEWLWLPWPRPRPWDAFAPGPERQLAYHIEEAIVRAMQRGA